MTTIPDDQSSAVLLTDKHGTQRYLDEFAQLHREGDLPALVDKSGVVCYYKHGMLHRDNGPAVVTSDQEAYYQNGALHRDNNLPAIVHFVPSLDGSAKEVMIEEYYKMGIRHRDNGPALTWSDGSYQCYKNGQLHNDHGPACHYAGKQETQYWLNGEQVNKVAHKVANLRESLFPKNDGAKKMKHGV